MSNAPARRAASLERRLAVLTAQAAKLRDKFRDIESEAAELAEHFDPDQNGLTCARDELRSAVDTMSGLV